jgi:solute carrier family 25, member 39/40
VVVMQLLRDIPFTMIFWTITENIRGPILQRTSGADTSDEAGSGSDTARLIYANAAAASAAGGIAAIATTPFDVIKTQQQTGAVQQSLAETARSIVSRNGFAGLWAGVLPRLLRVAPASAMVITTYEFLKKQILASHNSQSTR